QPLDWACARHSSERIADSWRPCGYLVSSALAHSKFSAEKAKLLGWISTGARRRGAISRTSGPQQQDTAIGSKRAAVCSLPPCGSGNPSEPRSAGSSIDLAEHDIDRSEDGGHVGEHVASHEKIHRLQVREARRADLAFVRLVAAVRDQVHAELAFGRLDRGVDFALRHVEALG